MRPPPAPATVERLVVEKSSARIAGMFDAIATRYDVLNHLLSGGLDLYWRARAIRALRFTGRERLLDVCTGTADLALAAIRAPGRGPRRVVGVDFSGAMLRIGRDKVGNRRLADVVNLAQGDALRLPIGSGTVDAVTVAFGIRNVESAIAACREMQRVLKPGGRVAILEFSLPRHPVIRRCYLWYFTHVLPRIGRLVSRHADAYTYLPASVNAFPEPESFSALLRDAGLRDIEAVPLTFGVVQLYLATNPERERAVTTPHGRD